MVSLIQLKPSSVELAADSAHRREDIRPAEKQDPTYREKFDDRTLFYDCIAYRDGVILIGPPLLNLEAAVLKGRYTLNGRSAQNVDTRRIERGQRTYVDFGGPAPRGVDLRIELPELSAEWTVTVVDDNALFEGRRVLFTLQKNENLTWIRDWAQYYSKIHRCDAVVIYDNSSTDYSIEDVSSALSSVDDVDLVAVIPWPYKYGPQGSPWVGPGVAWDSDFCQIGVFQDAQYRLLQSAYGGINADVDELVVPTGSKGVFEALDASTTGVVGYSGHWISNVPNRDRSGVPRHTDFSLINDPPKRCQNKWTFRPSALPDEAHPTAHYVRGVAHRDSDEFYTAHFTGLNSGWKAPNRIAETEPEPDARVDVMLVSALRRAFPLSREGAVQGDHDDCYTGGSATAITTASELRRHLQFVLMSRLPMRSCTKMWVWNADTSVFEFGSSLGTLAVDVSVRDEEAVIAVSARRKGAVAEGLRTALEREFGEGLAPNRSGQGLIVGRISNPALDANSTCRVVCDLVEKAVKIVLSDLAVKSRPAAGPLVNLRDDRDAWGLLNEKLRAFAGSDKVLYVPNYGNWGDALIHVGTTQFLKAFRIPFEQRTREEVRDVVKGVARLGGRMADITLVSGGGGAWRSATSGNRSFVDECSKVFRKVVVLPHTYEAPAVDKSGERLYFTRDDSLSLESIPDAIPIHDMAFFLQLPGLRVAEPVMDVGYFMRTDAEKTPRAGHVGDGYDISLLGTHRSSVTPFFEIIALYKRVVTDRMHVAIAGAMLGREVQLYPGNYAKADAVFTRSLRRQFPTVELMRW